MEGKELQKFEYLLNQSINCYKMLWKKLHYINTTCI